MIEELLAAYLVACGFLVVLAVLAWVYLLNRN